MRVLFSLLILSELAHSAVPLLPAEPKTQAKKLKDYLTKEKKNFDQRESQKKDLTDLLDKLNSEQNNVRVRLSLLGQNQQELNMAVENLSMEYEQQKALEKLHRQRLFMLLKVVYRIKRDGIVRFLFNGEDMGQLASRVRVLYRTLRSHSLITKQLEERASRIRESEIKTTKAKQQLQSLLDELIEQEHLLSSLLSKKKAMLVSVKQKQSAFLAANAQYKKLEKEIAQMFTQLPSAKPPEKEYTPQQLGNLPLPAEGHIIKGFGKSIHEKFKTVTYHKGIEIEAEHNSPVIAILPGSRKQEITKMLSVMLGVIDDFNDYQFVIAGAPSQDYDLYEPFLKSKNVHFIANKTYDLLSHSTAALVTSGTATLETALFKVPEVVCYKGSWVSYQIAKRIITLKFISLVNLIMDKEVVKELIQDELNTQNLTIELHKILKGTNRNQILKEYDALEKKLGGQGASEKTAQLIVDFVKK